MARKALIGLITVFTVACVALAPPFGKADEGSNSPQESNPAASGAEARNMADQAVMLRSLIMSDKEGARNEGVNLSASDQELRNALVNMAEGHLEVISPPPTTREDAFVCEASHCVLCTTATSPVAQDESQAAAGPVALRAAAREIDELAHRLECLEMFAEADKLRDTAQQVRLQARPTPVAPGPTRLQRSAATGLFHEIK